MFHHCLRFPLICVLLLHLYIQPSTPRSSTDEPLAEAQEVRNWALRFGKDIKDGSSEATCLRKITENYNENIGAKVEWVDATKMLEEMRIDVQNMLNWKKEAVARIAIEAEKLASNHTYDKHLKFKYINARRLFDPRYEQGNRSYGLARGNLTAMEMSPHPNFEQVRVNTYHSAIHVPINVYDSSPAVINDCKWSEGLTQVFRNNLAFDPNLSWQFFGSSNGFLRVWPAAKWRVPLFVKRENITAHQQLVDEAEALDLYDSRIRSWYIQGAASPKDMIILLDGSGSMTGQRKEIAKNVVLNILDTLTDDDYFTVIRFTDVMEPIVECFGDDLVPANKQNIREFKERFDGLNTSEIANFTQALTHAFETLNRYAREKEGAMCNQAIMLVTDGAPDNFQPIFEKYNWPRIPVRVFTYLVGREVTETKEVNWMACHNRGYYTHVANLAEVREQVQLYIPVMSRPLVLAGKRPFTWTPVYADVTEVPLTNWVWEERQREKIRAGIRAKTKRDTGSNLGMDDPYYMVTESQQEDLEREDEVVTEDGEEAIDKSEADYEEILEKNQSLENKPRMKRASKSDKKDKKDKTDKKEKTDKSPPKVSDNNDDSDTGEIPPETSPAPPTFYAMGDSPKKGKKTVHLMTTVAAPVFDTKNSTNITVRVLVKNVWVEQQREIQTANLLGVAGIDVPIKEIVKLTPAYKLGVNEYSFALTNNGYLLYHPDLRPIFQDMLKPFYSSVDLIEVELANNNLEAREVDPGIDALRKNMIDRVIGWKKMDVKMHLDGLKRVITRTNSYYYGPIEGTPFSLAISLPEPYGHYRVDGQIEVKRRDENYTQYFKGKNWRVHPDWVYCDNPSSTTMSGITFRTPEEAIGVFLEQAMKNAANVRWRTSSVRPHVYDTLSCEKDLVQSLVFDAKATDIDPKKCGAPKTPSKYETYIAQPVPYTNLLTLVVLNTCTCGSIRKVEPMPIDYGGDCSVIRKERYRVRPTTCINHNPEEVNIKICGKGILNAPSYLLLVTTTIFTMLTSITVFHSFVCY